MVSTHLHCVEVLQIISETNIPKPGDQVRCINVLLESVFSLCSLLSFGQSTSTVLSSPGPLPCSGGGRHVAAAATGKKSDL